MTKVPEVYENIPSCSWPLELWVDVFCPELARDIEIHLEEVGGLRDEDLEDTRRMILISIRERWPSTL